MSIIISFELFRIKVFLPVYNDIILIIIICLRGLSSSSVLFKFAVMDSKVRPKITAVSQWTDGAVKNLKKKKANCISFTICNNNKNLNSQLVQTPHTQFIQKFRTRLRLAFCIVQSCPFTPNSAHHLFKEILHRGFSPPSVRTPQLSTILSCIIHTPQEALQFGNENQVC